MPESTAKNSQSWVGIPGTLMLKAPLRSARPARTSHPAAGGTLISDATDRPRMAVPVATTRDV